MLVPVLGLMMLVPGLHESMRELVLGVVFAEVDGWKVH